MSYDPKKNELTIPIPSSEYVESLKFMEDQAAIDTRRTVYPLVNLDNIINLCVQINSCSKVLIKFFDPENKVSVFRNLRQLLVEHEKLKQQSKEVIYDFDDHKYFDLRIEKYNIREQIFLEVKKLTEFDRSILKEICDKAFVI